MAKHKTRRRRHPGGVTGGGSYKNGQHFKIKPPPRQTDTVYPGDIHSIPEFKEQYQIMLSLRAEAQKALRAAQQTARKLEKREHLLQLAEQVDGAVSKLEDAVGTLHRLLHLLGEFAIKPIRPDATREAE